MATLDDLRRTAVALPGSEERAMTGGAAWFVRSKLYAWECHPWPSIPEGMRAVIASELVVGVKVAESIDALALVEMAPDVFLRTTTPWGEPKLAFRMAGIDQQHRRLRGAGIEQGPDRGRCQPHHYGVTNHHDA